MKEESVSMLNALLKCCAENINNAKDFWEKELWIIMRDGLEYIKETEINE